VLEAARAAAAPEAWRDGVTGPLRVTVSELIAGIERGSAGSICQQESFQAEIRKLLEADWFGAIERLPGAARVDERDVAASSTRCCCTTRACSRAPARHRGSRGGGGRGRGGGRGAPADRSGRSDRGVGLGAAARVVGVLPVRAPLPARRGAARSDARR
jgi:hypothetical protein